MTAVYDPTGDQMLCFGGHEVRNDLWALSLSGDLEWRELSPEGELPPPRAGHSASYDSRRSRMLVVGGANSLLGGARNDAWSLTLTPDVRWERLDPNPPAPPLVHHSAVYDSIRDRVVARAYYDTWALALSGSPAWQHLADVGTAPNTQMASTLFDPLRNRMIMFGGYGNHTFALTLGDQPTWSHISPVQPLGDRAGHAAVYDPLRDRLLVWGGYNFEFYQRLLALPLRHYGAWHQVATSTPPTEEWGKTAVYDPKRDRVLFLGGSEGLGGGLGIWELRFDPIAQWSLVNAPGQSPGPHGGVSAILDPDQDRVVVFGGYPLSGQWANDTWALELSPAPHWSRLETSGPKPSRRWGQSAVWDPARRRMVVFGGTTGSYIADFLDDVWELKLDAVPEWRRLTPIGELPPRQASMSAIYDPVRDRMVIFGGFDFNSNKTFALTMTEPPVWSRLRPGGEIPRGRFDHRAVYDPMRDRMIICGGSGGGGSDTWFLNWREPTIEVAVDIRPGSAANPMNPRASGIVPVAIMGAPDFDVHRLDFAAIRVGGAPVDVLGNGAQKLAFKDVNGDAIEDLITHVEMSALDIEDTARDADAGKVTLELEAVTLLENELVRGRDEVHIVPGPSRDQVVSGEINGARLRILTAPPRGALRVEVVLKHSDAVSLEIFDLKGRKVSEHRFSAPETGPHVFELGDRSRFQPGIYVARLTCGSTRIVRRFAVIR